MIAVVLFFCDFCMDRALGIEHVMKTVWLVLCHGGINEIPGMRFMLKDCV